MSNNTPTGSIEIQGTLFRGETLTVVSTLEDADGLGTITYQWYRDGVAIEGATGATYNLTGDDVDASITVVATYTDGAGNQETVTSAATNSVGQIYLIGTEGESAQWQYAEDGSSSFTLVLGVAPAFNVTVTITLPSELTWADGSTGPRTITFTSTDFSVAQTLLVAAVDDLTIEGDQVYELQLAFSSDDPTYDGLTENISVTVIDNDFQRTEEPEKLPSDGNNYVIYDSADGDTATTGTDQYSLGAGNDRLEVSGDLWDANNVQQRLFLGGAGNDYLSGVIQADGQDGNDTIISATTGNFVSMRFSYSSNNRYVGYDLQVLAGGKGNDVIDASASTVRVDIAGGMDSDHITGSAQDDVIWGDGYNAAAPHTHNEQIGGGQSVSSNSEYNDDAYLQGLANNRLDSVRAGGVSFSGTVTEYEGDDTINAGAGDDLVYGGGGADTIDGGDGSDTLYGGDGNDVIDGGNDADTIEGGLGDDEIRGGEGNDTLRGGAGADTLYGESGDDAISGGADDDVLYGGEGSDSLTGGEGDDTLFGAEENDTLWGNEGDDTLSGDAGADTLYGDAGADTLRGGDGNDILYGGADNDILYGDAGDDTLYGGNGQNTLYGGADNDVLYGGVDVDTLDGGAGDDRLEGGAAGDILTGGAGRDTFVLAIDSLAEAALTTPVYDRVTDFETGADGDIIDLAALHAANLAEGYGDEWSGTEFAYAHGYIYFVQSGNDTHVMYDRDGLNGEYDGKIIAVLENTTASEVIEGVNSNPPLSDNLFLIESENLAVGLSEDGGSSITYRIVLGQAPTAPVTVTIQGGDQIAVDGSSEVTLTFTAENWWIPQSVTVTASDDLLIEGNVPADIVHTFSSTDGEFDGLRETHAVTVIDNDFQRTLEPEKLPSDGNNYVIYDSADGDTATTGTNQYSLGAGNDRLDVSGDLWGSNAVQQRLFLGGAGNDTLSGVIQADGQDGNDTIISATTGNFVSMRFSYSSNVRYVGYDLQVLAGGKGNDVIDASASTVRVDIAGGMDSDHITGSAQDDVIWGDGYNAAAPHTHNEQIGASQSVSNSEYNDDAYLQGLANNRLDSVRAGGVSFSGTVTVYEGDDTINAGAGDDLVYGGGGADTIDGGDGSDTLYGGDGNDVIDGGNDADTIEGGLGDDEIRGGEGNDTLRGGAGLDLIYGGAGDDSLDGGAFNDVLYGGEGNDTLSGGTEDDLLYGEDGADTLNGNAGDDTLFGGTNNDVLRGDQGNDTLYGDVGNDTLYGGADDDVLYGGAGEDTLYGDAGIDTLFGGAGNDSLYGGNNADNLIGGEGDDFISGGPGGDVLSGGAGRDTFHFTHDALDDDVDVITDFEVGASGDVLDLYDVHQVNVDEGNATFGANEFPFTHGYFRIIQRGDDAIVGYDRDGHGDDFFFEPLVILNGVDGSDLTEENFGFGSSNFGLVRTGFTLEQTRFNDGSATLEIALWGGQPSADVTIIIRDLAGNEVGRVVFTAIDWDSTKTITLDSVPDDFIADRDLRFSIDSTDTNFEEGDLATVVINETIVFENTSIVAPEVSIVSAASDTISVDTNLDASTDESSELRLVSVTDPSIVIVTTINFVGQQGTIVIPDTTLSGIMEFVGYATAAGETVTFSVTIEFDNYATASVASNSVQVTEGGSTTVAIEVTLDAPAGQELTLSWMATPTGGNGVDGADFNSGELPSGTLTFARGETSQTIYIEVADDNIEESVEAFIVSFSTASGFDAIPGSVTVLINDDDLPGQTGDATTWNGINVDVSGTIARTEIDVTDSGETGFRAINYDEGAQTLTLEFWGNPSELGQNFDLTILLGAGAEAVVTFDTALDNWTALSNLQDGVLAIAGIGAQEVSGGESVRLFSITFTNVNPNEIPILQGGIIGNTEVLPGALYQTTVIDTSDGEVSFSGEDGTYITDFDVSQSDIDRAINSQDALMILQIANGTLGPSDLHPLQFTAADVDRSGDVSLLDAWILLRHIVGIESDLIGQVGSVQATEDLSDIDADNTQPDTLDSVTTDGGTPPDLTLFIIGDVDGSYRPETMP